MPVAVQKEFEYPAKRTRAIAESIASATKPWNAEREIRDSVLEDLAATRKSLLRWLRRELACVYRRLAEDAREGTAFVTADDARAILDNDPSVPGPDVLNRNFLGSLFMANGWEWTGDYHQSKTNGSHANRLKCWRYTGKGE
jgi:hypothetical protein